jgi:hypothetical protein
MISRAQHESWKNRLAHEVSWLMILKLAALAALWACFFSASHRCRVDGQATAKRLGVAAASGGQSTMADAGDRCD